MIMNKCDKLPKSPLSSLAVIGLHSLMNKISVASESTWAQRVSVTLVVAHWAAWAGNG